MLKKMKTAVVVMAIALMAAGICAGFSACDIWSGQGQPKSGGLYSLAESYNYGWLKKENLSDIAYYYNNRYNDAVLFTESLSGETENKIKQTYLETFYPELLIDFSGYDYLEIVNPADGVRVTAYYGTYNDCVVVSVWDDFVCYDRPQTFDVTIGGAVFEDFWTREIFVWIENEPEKESAGHFFRADFGGCLVNLPYEVYRSDTQPVSHDKSLIVTMSSTEQLGIFSETYSQSWSEEEGRWVRDESFSDLISGYDESFFENNQIVTFFLTAAGGAYHFELSSVTYSGEVLAIEINHISEGMGHAALVDWFGIVEIEKVPAYTETVIKINNRGW